MEEGLQNKASPLISAVEAQLCVHNRQRYREHHCVPARVEQVGAGNSLVGEGAANTSAAVAVALEVGHIHDRTQSEYRFERGQETTYVGAEGEKLVENRSVVAVHLAEHPLVAEFVTMPVTVAAKNELHIEKFAADVVEVEYVFVAKLAEKRRTYHSRVWAVWDADHWAHHHSTTT